MTSSTRSFCNASVLIVALSGLIARAPVDDCECGDDVPFGVYAAPVAAPAAQDQSFDVSEASDKISDEIDWQPFNLETVEAAREAGKTLWIHVVHDGCGPCEKLKRTVFVDPAFVTRVNERLVAVQVDRFKNPGPAVVSACEAGGDDPVDIFVYPNGKGLRYYGAPESREKFDHRLNGVQVHTDLAKWFGYPVSANPGKWKLDGETVDADHLLTHANHSGKFNPEWVRSLSRDQLLTLHDHDHDHNVRWAFVPPLNPELKGNP